MTCLSEAPSIRLASTYDADRASSTRLRTMRAKPRSRRPRCPGHLNAAGPGTGLEGEILDQSNAIGEVVEGDVVLEPIVDGNQLTGLPPIELGTDNVIEDLEAAQEKKPAEEGCPKGNHQDGSR